MTRFTLASVSRSFTPPSPRWSPSPTFVTTATSQRSKPSSARNTPRRSRRRRQVHSQSGTGVDFHDYAALHFQWTRNVAHHHVDTADVEADRLGSIDCAGRDLRMNKVCHVGGRAARAEVRVAANQHS